MRTDSSEHNSNVEVAFQSLIEALERSANHLNQEQAKALEQGDYVVVERLSQRVSRLMQILQKIRDIQREWAAPITQRSSMSKGRRRRVQSRLARGLRTPEEDFRLPILEALVELGGSAPVGEVLDLVEQKVKWLLTENDRENLNSRSKSVRWRNTAQWCRNTLVAEGLMKNDSPRGVWEISDEGVKVLQEIIGAPNLYSF